MYLFLLFRKNEIQFKNGSRKYTQATTKGKKNKTYLFKTGQRTRLDSSSYPLWLQNNKAKVKQKDATLSPLCSQDTSVNK